MHNRRWSSTQRNFVGMSKCLILNIEIILASWSLPMNYFNLKTLFAHLNLYTKWGSVMGKGPPITYKKCLTALFEHHCSANRLKIEIWTSETFLSKPIIYSKHYIFTPVCTVCVTPKFRERQELRIRFLWNWHSLCDLEANLLENWYPERDFQTKVLRKWYPFRENITLN